MFHRWHARRPSVSTERFACKPADECPPAICEPQPAVRTDPSPGRNMRSKFHCIMALMFSICCPANAESSEGNNTGCDHGLSRSTREVLHQVPLMVPYFCARLVKVKKDNFNAARPAHGDQSAVSADRTVSPASLKRHVSYATHCTTPSASCDCS